MTGWGVWALCVIVLVNTLFIGGIAVGLMLVHRRLTGLSRELDPLIRRTGETLQRVEAVSGDLQRRTEEVLDRSVALVDQLARKVDTTTALAEETISQPLIGAASVMAGISRGLKTYREQAVQKGDDD
jgi:hypothetical protein